MPLMFTDSVNQYFSNIGDNLASVIPTVNSASFRSFLGIKDYPPVILKPTDIRELKNICSLFSLRKAPGYDNISMGVIKHSFHLISAPPANVINHSLLKGALTDKLKIGK